ncbi:MAG: hypothetical protein LUQ71_03300, partial [Methanoregula sp.]|nr:hypothetical protein [Methanoregula sp.]
MPPLHTPPGKRAGIPAWVIAGAGILVIAVAAVILSPFLMQALSGNTSSSGSAGNGHVQPVTVPLNVTPLPVTTTPSISTLPQTTTTIVTTIPITIPTTATVQRTRATVTTVPTFTVITATPTPEFTSQITLSVTQIPDQPPADTYASKTPGAPYIDPFVLESRIHELINIQRQQSGLSTLTYDS